MRYPNSNRNGFTLIEMLIAITLGIGLLLICYQGLRVVAQTLVNSKRMSLENDMLHIGVVQAWEEVDFWTMDDDPNDTSHQALRGGDTTNGYQPFAPFSITPDNATPGGGLGAAPFQDATPNTFDEPTSGVHGGWNPSPLAWAAWNPRTWTRANPEEESDNAYLPVQGWGPPNYYPLPPFFHASTAPNPCPLTPYGTFEIYDNLDTTKSWHYWYDDQVKGLLDALGSYGVYEYLPSNAYVVYHGTSLPLGSQNAYFGYQGGIQFPCQAVSWGWMPSALICSGSWFNSNDGNQDFDHNMKGRTKNSTASRYFMPSYQVVAANTTNYVVGGDGNSYINNSPLSTSALLTRTYAPLGFDIIGGHGAEAYFSNSQYITPFLTNSLVNEDLAPLRPITWDDVTLEAHRYIAQGHSLCLCMLSLQSALTGNTFIIPFTCLGTSLRGARQQRLPPSAPSSSLGGWVTNPYVDPTLDYVTPP